MATIAEAEERMLELLGYPNRAKPNRHQRLAWLNLAIDSFAKESELSTKPYLVDKFPLQVDASTSEYSIPVDDFSSLYYVVSDPDFFPTEAVREIETINFPDADLYLGGNAPYAGTGKVQKMGWRGVGADRKLIIFPPNSTDHLVVWYNKMAPSEPSLQDSIYAHDSFHLSLIPAAAALMGMAEWKWDGLMPAEEDVKRQWLLERSNPMSLVNYYARQYDFFIRKTHRPNTAHPSNKLQGFASKRRARRRVHRILG